MKLRNIVLILCSVMALSVSGAGSEYGGKDLLRKATGLTDSNPERAIVLLKQAYEIGVKSNNDGMCARALNLYAWCMYQKGDYELSMNLYYNALNYCPDNDRMLLAEIKTGIGVIDGLFGRVQPGEKNLFEALTLAKQYRASKMITRIYTDLGSLYAENNNIIRGAYYYKIALDYSSRLGDKHFESRLLSNLGIIEPKCDKQLFYLTKALKISREINDLYNASSCYLNLGEYYYNKRCFDEALRMLDKSLALAMDIDAKDVTVSALDLRIKIYSALKNFKMAYYYSNQKSQLKERINNKQRMEAIDNTITSRQMLKLREQNELQKKETEIYQDRIYVLWCFVAIVLIILFVANKFQLYRKHKKNEFIQQQYELEKTQNKVMELEMARKEEALSAVNNELETTKERLEYLQLFLDNRNDLLEKIRQKIRESYKLDGNEYVSSLKNINTYIGQFQTKKDAKLHPKYEMQTDVFVKRLKEQFPNLTKGECKLAVYIRSGLSGKEISLLTGTQIKSIETYRHRLRRELNLPSEQDMSEFLQRIC